MDAIKTNIKVNFLTSVKSSSLKLIYFRVIKKVSSVNLNLIYYFMHFMTILKFRYFLDVVKNILNLSFLAPLTVTLNFKSAVLLNPLDKKA